MTATKQRIGTISGVAISPGVSKNGRRYKPVAIQRAYKRLSERIASPNGLPVVMRTHHPANGSDMAVTNIAARVTGVSLTEANELRWKAEIPDTTAGRDVAALTTTDQPYLSSVSIRGWWVGESTTDADGNETGDDLEIDGLDFTPNPGVGVARIDGGAAEADGRTVITESAEEAVVTLETTEATAPTPGSDYADPGYQKDGKKRYPLDTAKKVRAAWAYINVPANQKPYTPKQLGRIKGKIKSAAKKAGIDIATETVALGLELTELLEAYASSCLDNGQGDIRVSGYTNEPADLAALGQRVALAALAGLAALDPDNDGDIDLAPGDAAPGGDDPICPNCSLVCVAGDAFCPACGSALPATETDDNAMESATSSTQAPTGESTTKKEPTVAESTETIPEGFAGPTSGVASPHGGTKPVEKPATEAVTSETAATEGATETQAAPLTEAERAKFDAYVTELGSLKPAEETAGTETTTTTTEQASTAEKVTFTAEEAREMAKDAVKEAATQMKAELTDEAIALVRSGGRKGVVRPVDESGAAKPLHEMSEEERNAYASDAWAAVLGR